MNANEKHIRNLTGDKKPEDNFKVPTGYFDSFSSQVKNRIEAQPQRGFSWEQLLRPVYSIPIAAAIVLLVGYFVFFSQNPTATQPQTASNAAIDTTGLSTASIEEYLLQDVSLIGIDEEVSQDLFALVFDSDTEAETTSPATTKQPNSKDTATQPSDDEIEEYLLYSIDETLIESL